MSTTTPASLTITPTTVNEVQEQLAAALEPSAESSAAPAAPATPAIPGEPDWDRLQLEVGSQAIAEHKAAWTAYQEHLAAGRRTLDNDLGTAWRDHIPDLRAHAKERFGFTDADLVVTDPRAVKLLYEHWQREHQPATTREPTAPRATPKSTARTAAVREAYARLQERHFQRDAMAVIEGLLPD